MDLVNEYITRTDWRVNENSNMAYSLQGLNYHLSSSLMAKYQLDKYSERVRQAHLSGALHLHNLGMLSPYCCGWDLQDLLRRGWGGVSGKVESVPAKHLSSALGQIITFLFTLQGETAGAVAFSNFDTLLAPFVRYDNLSYPQVKQMMQEFIFSLNNSTRVGFQSPFTNLALNLTPYTLLRDVPVEIGGKTMPETYGDFQTEMDIINRAFAEVVLEGDAKDRVFSFPIPTYDITPDFDWDNPVYEPIWAMTAKYGMPYFGNYVNSDLSAEDVRSMCCRLRLDNRELRRRGGSLFGAAPLTGSVMYLTLNIPRLGYEAVDRDDFFARFANLLDIAAEAMALKRALTEELTEKGLYPYSKAYLASIKQATGKYWSNHFNTFGIIGVHEACLNLLGVGIQSPEGKRFAEEVLHFALEKIQHYQVMSGDLCNLEASPAESSCYRLAKTDKKQYPDIITSGTDDVPYYTNSTNLPVGYTCNLAEMLNHQESLQSLYTGGAVAHVFLGERLPHWTLARAMIKTIVEQWRVPYVTLTPTFSICPRHGYLTGEHEKCPECGATCEIYSRITGYIRPRSQWNVGKRQEAKERKVFDYNSLHTALS